MWHNKVMLHIGTLREHHNFEVVHLSYANELILFQQMKPSVIQNLNQIFYLLLAYYFLLSNRYTAYKQYICSQMLKYFITLLCICIITQLTQKKKMYISQHIVFVFHRLQITNIISALLDTHFHSVRLACLTWVFCTLTGTKLTVKLFHPQACVPV